MKTSFELRTRVTTKAISPSAFVPSLPVLDPTRAAHPPSFQSQPPNLYRTNALHPRHPPTRRTTPCAVQPPPEPPSPSPQPPKKGLFSTVRLWWQQRAEKASMLRSYGVAAFISYGLFDAITYSISFLFSLRAYLAAGKVLTWKTLPQVLALMWGINNLSRPFRIAGALAIAPLIDAKVVKPVGSAIMRLRKGNHSG